MINGFKTQTQELSEYERREVLPRVAEGLKDQSRGRECRNQ